MSLESHVQQLMRKHAELDAKIASEQRRPGADTLEIQTLKRDKLRLKEQIERAKTAAA